MLTYGVPIYPSIPLYKNMLFFYRIDLLRPGTQNILTAASARTRQNGGHYRAFIILFISADRLGSGSAMALSVSTCLIRHIDFLT